VFTKKTCIGKVLSQSEAFIVAGYAFIWWRAFIHSEISIFTFKKHIDACLSCATCRGVVVVTVSASVFADGFSI